MQKLSKKFNFGWLSLRKRKKHMSEKIPKDNKIEIENKQENEEEKKSTEINNDNTMENENYKDVASQPTINSEKIICEKMETTESVEKQINYEDDANNGKKESKIAADQKLPVLKAKSAKVQEEQEMQSKFDDILHQTDIVDSPGYMKRVRLSSMSSNNSRDSSTSVSSGMKEKIFKWKRDSAKSPKNIYISNPLGVRDAQMEQGVDLVEFSDVNEQIDKIANDRLSSYNSIDRSRSRSSKEETPILPKKPVNFQIKQLEKLLSGQINPPTAPRDKSEVMLLLDSLRVMQRIQQVSCQDDQEDPVYDVPRRCYD